jgi:pSer/pThr/pTyr-binding forkhead associated (FHA) protein
MAELSLEIVEGPSAGRQVPLSQPLVVGRGQDAQVVLDDPRASRSHARITPHGGTAVVEDLGSSNGTFVRGNQLHAPATIGPGDDILIGVTVLELRSMAQIASQPSAVRAVPQAIAAQAAVPPPPPPPQAPAAPPTAETPPAAPQAMPPLAAQPRQPPPPPAVAGRQAEIDEDLAALLDVRVKRRAQAAPLAIFALVVLVVIIYLAAK